MSLKEFLILAALGAGGFLLYKRMKTVNPTPAQSAQIQADRVAAGDFTG